MTPSLGGFLLLHTRGWEGGANSDTRGAGVDSVLCINVVSAPSTVHHKDAQRLAEARGYKGYKG